MLIAISKGTGRCVIRVPGVVLRRQQSTNQHKIDVHGQHGDPFDFDDRFRLHNIERVIQCTAISKQGLILAEKQEIDRREFLLDNSLHPRDLRYVRETGLSRVPNILARKKCIFVSMLDYQVAIQVDKVLVLYPERRSGDGPSDTTARDTNNTKLVSSVIQRLQFHEKQRGDCVEKGLDSLPFELKILETILILVTHNLQVEAGGHLRVTRQLLEALEDDVKRDHLRGLLLRSKELSGFVQKCALLRSAIGQVLNCDEDLHQLYLSDPRQDHAGAEFMLESYFKQIEETLQHVEQATADIQNTEDVVNIILDANRNSLILLQLRISIASISLCSGMLFSAMYGMNLTNHLERASTGFFQVSASVCIVSGLIGLGNLATLLRVKKVAMMGTGPPIWTLALSRHRSQGTHSFWSLLGNFMFREALFKLFNRRRRSKTDT